MSRRILKYFTVAVVVLAVLAVVGAAVIENRFSALPEPGRLEASIALRLRNLSIPSSASEARNPLAGRPEAREDGEDVFAAYCAVCHNDDGRGGGAIGPNLNPRVPDLTSARTQEMTDGEIYYVIEHGVRWTGMPSWKRELSEEEMWQLVSYIRHLAATEAAEDR